MRELSIQAGHSWDGSMARTVCGEQEYYEELVKQYKAWARVRVVAVGVNACVCAGCCCVRHRSVALAQEQQRPCMQLRAPCAALIMSCACACACVCTALLQLYPYHLAGYVARVLRITPFRYYSGEARWCDSSRCSRRQQAAAAATAATAGAGSRCRSAPHAPSSPSPRLSPRRAPARMRLSFPVCADVLFLMLRDERSYDRIPNFTVSSMDA